MTADGLIAAWRSASQSWQPLPPGFEEDLARIGEDAAALPAMLQSLETAWWPWFEAVMDHAVALGTPFGDRCFALRLPGAESAHSCAAIGGDPLAAIRAATAGVLLPASVLASAGSGGVPAEAETAFLRILAGRAEALLRRSAPPLVVIQICLGLLLIDSLLVGRVAAFDRLVRRVAPLQPNAVASLGQMLYRLGVTAWPAAADWRRLAQTPQPPNLVVARRELAHLSLKAPPAWNEWLFEHWLRPSLAQALADGRFTDANALVDAAVWSVQMHPHTEERWCAVGDAYFGLIEAAADRLGQRLGHLPLAEPPGEAPLRLAWITSGRLDWGSPIRSALLFATALQRHHPGGFRITLYSTEGNPDAEVVKAFQDVGVTVRWLDQRPAVEGLDDVAVSAIVLRQELAREGIGVAVFFRGHVVFESVASHVHLAPVQLFWSMGYDWPSYAAMDGRLSCLPGPQPVRLRDGRPWRPIRFLYKPLWPGRGDEAAAERRRLGLEARGPVLGTLCQAYKLDSEDFIAALAEILRHLPEAVYLWTGRTPPHSVVERMRRHGILDRCVFIGWVDPVIYHHLLDIFLDTFPFGNGNAAAEAMSLGTPVVSLRGEQNLKGIVFEPARLGWLGEAARAAFTDCVAAADPACYLLAETAEDYVGLVLRLARDRDFRDACARLARDLAGALLFDDKAAADSLAAAILAVAAEPAVDRHAE